MIVMMILPAGAGGCVTTATTLYKLLFFDSSIKICNDSAATSGVPKNTILHLLLLVVVLYNLYNDDRYWCDNVNVFDNNDNDLILVLKPINNDGNINNNNNNDNTLIIMMIY